jgi:hypothetical protein
MIKLQFLFFIPPSLPSPTGEGAGTKPFPPGGNGKGGVNSVIEYDAQKFQIVTINYFKHNL